MPPPRARWRWPSTFLLSIVLSCFMVMTWSQVTTPTTTTKAKTAVADDSSLPSSKFTDRVAVAVEDILL
jgi:hypothetical protein